MTWSVGMRAPDWRELAAAWYDSFIAEHLPRARYRDPDLKPPRHRGEIPVTIVGQVRQTVEAALSGADDATFAAWFGAYLTEPKENLEPEPPDDALEPPAFRRALERAGKIQRGPSRLLFTQTQGGEVLLFAAGDTYRLRTELLGVADLITGRRTLTLEQLRPWLDDPDCLDLLCSLYNQGHYELPD